MEKIQCCLFFNKNVPNPKILHSKLKIYKYFFSFSLPYFSLLQNYTNLGNKRSAMFGRKSITLVDGVIPSLKPPDDKHSSSARLFKVFR